jgi:lipoprotein-anchoring transpeptidase ErfK/SrfK
MTRVRVLTITAVVGALVAATFTGIALGRPAATATPIATPAPNPVAAADQASTTRAAVAKPAGYVSVRSNVGDGGLYGVGMPVVLTFTKKIPKADRATVQKRLSVTSTPAQRGAWYWFSDQEVHFRPKHYWQAGTAFRVTANLAGMSLSNGYVARNGLAIGATVTSRPLEISIDAKRHRVVATRDGRVLRVMKASTGKKATPSSSGRMVIMQKAASQIFDSSLGGGTPVDAPGGYRELVQWTARLTWGGEFIHAAPWSVKAQGHRNVSHGCTNLSARDAKWIYDHSHIGDPVVVKGTSRALAWGNGWTDWDASWSTYAKGNALPVQ